MTRPIELAEATDEARRVAEEAGRLSLSHYKSVAVEIKPDGSEVTAADREAEELIRKRLESFLPEAAILGVGRIAERPVVKQGRIVVGSVLPLSLTFDHRIVDGKEAVTFLIRLKEILEDPKSLLFFGE